MSVRHVAIALALACLPISSGANACPALKESFNFEQLRGFVDCSKIGSLDELIPQLPERYRANFVMLYESGSRQGASFQEPRVVSFLPDGNLFLAFAGNAKAEGGNLLEVIEWDPAKAEFMFKEVVFGGAKSTGATRPHFNATPASCSDCHGEKPKPLWDPYPTWGKVYGSFSHAMFSGTKEAIEFANFLESGRSKNRYRSLVFSKEMTSPQYINSLREKRGAPVMISASASNSFDPLSEVTHTLYSRNSRRVAQRFAAVKQSPYRFALAATALGCVPTCKKPNGGGVAICAQLGPETIEEFIPASALKNKSELADLTAETARINKKNVDERYDEIKKVNPLPEHFAAYDDPNQIRSQDNDIWYVAMISTLRFLGARMGLDPKEWSISVQNGNNEDYSFAANTRGIQPYLAAIVDALVDSDESINKVVGSALKRSKLDGFSASRVDDSKLPEICAKLKQQSFAALAPNAGALTQCGQPRGRPLLDEKDQRCLEKIEEAVSRE